MRPAVKKTATIAALLCSALLFAGFSSGPPNGRTGAPGDSNCTVGCHSTFGLNTGSGLLQITAQSTYVEDEVIDISIDLSQTSQMRWGFEATVLDADNLPIGNITVTDAVRTQIETDGLSGRQYIKHTSTGTDAGTSDDAPGWSFQWTAPSTLSGPVTIYVAGNAANNNGFNTGDYIYTTSHTINVGAVVCCTGIRGNVDNDPGDNIDISDLVYFVSFSFGGGPAPACLEEADIDGSTTLDIGDIVYLVAYSFGGGPAPLAC